MAYHMLNRCISNGLRNVQRTVGCSFVHSEKSTWFHRHVHTTRCRCIHHSQVQHAKRAGGSTQLPPRKIEIFGSNSDLVPSNRDLETIPTSDVVLDQTAARRPKMKVETEPLDEGLGGSDRTVRRNQRNGPRRPY